MLKFVDDDRGNNRENNGNLEGDRGTHHKTNGYTSEGDVSDTIPDEGHVSNQ